MTAAIPVPCAIYTRKSSEEGLEQAFNSLDAQAVACLAYIESQRHEGWKALRNRYDDGGISGATMERPALQSLLADIDAGRVKMVVVYKIDRLTRTLADFARLVERFDAAGCSFVSVTQAFNTSTSMGRLTLNVLLSFAQFEREVTGERIRDKIAASKKKGMWMGGLVPLGYARLPGPQENRLVVHGDEASMVRQIFDLYERLGNLGDVATEVERLGLRSKRHQFADGRTRGGSVLTRGQIHFLLTNPLYRGLVRHRGTVMPGLHEAIIDAELWDRVQAKLQQASVRPRGRGRQSGEHANPNPVRSPFIGKIFDEAGRTLCPTHAQKGGRRHRYYVSRHLMLRQTASTPEGWRLPAEAFERKVVQLIARQIKTCAGNLSLLGDPVAADAAGLVRRAGAAVDRIAGTDPALLAELVRSIHLATGSIRITLDREILSGELAVRAADLSAQVIEFNSPFSLRRRGVEVRIVAGAMSPEPDPVLVRLLARAHSWAMDIRAGRSLADLARRDGHSESYIRTRLPMAFLAPKIQAAILEGKQPPDLSAETLVRKGIPPDWSEQAHRFGFST